MKKCSTKLENKGLTERTGIFSLEALVVVKKILCLQKKAIFDTKSVFVIFFMKTNSEILG